MSSDTPMKTVALVDPLWVGHHPMYFSQFTAAFLRRHPEIPRIKCGHRTVVFKVSDIEQFLAQRAVA